MFLRSHPGVPNRDPQHPDYVPHINMGYPGSQNVKAKEKAVQRYERRIKRQQESEMLHSLSSAVSPDLDHDESMDLEETVTDVQCNAENEKATQTNATCYQAAKIQQLEAEIKRLTQELKAQQQAAVYYNEKSTHLQEVLIEKEFTANNLSEKQLKYFTDSR